MQRDSTDYKIEAETHEAGVQKMDSQIASIQATIQSEESRAQTNMAAAQRSADSLKQNGGDEHEIDVWETKVATLQSTLDRELLKLNNDLRSAQKARDDYQSQAERARSNQQQAEAKEKRDQVNNYAQRATDNDPNGSSTFQ